MKTKNLIVLCLILSILVPSYLVIEDNRVEANTNLEYTNVDIKQVKVTSDYLNVRTGPSIDHEVVTQVKEDEILDVIGALGDDWYIIYLEDKSVGVVASEWTEVLKYIGIENVANDVDNSSNNTVDLSSDETQLIDLINNERKNLGLKEFEIDMDLVKIARDKAKDLIDNNSFSHNSPNFGSLDDMLKSCDYKYMKAAENIAGNPDVTEAHNNIMNSKSHKKHIINKDFSHMGIAVLPDSRFGKLIIEIYVKK